MISDVIKRTLLNNVNTIEAEYHNQEIENIQNCDWDDLEILLKSSPYFEKFLIHKDNDKETYYYLKGIKVFETNICNEFTRKINSTIEKNINHELMLLENFSLVAFRYSYKREEILVNNKITATLKLTRKKLPDISFTTQDLDTTVELFEEILNALQ